MATYRDAGVDLDAADAVLDRIKPAVTRTWHDGVMGGFGGFAAGIRIPAGYRNPVLMMSTDGVGTKAELARQAGRFDGLGWDLVAMCIDDLVAAGARPIAMTDYMAVGRIDVDMVSAIVASVAAACEEAGVALLGGETAEHPGVMEMDAFDLAGAALGVVEADAVIDGSAIRPGDAVIGLESPNLRSNGFSFVRMLLDRSHSLRPGLCRSRRRHRGDAARTVGSLHPSRAGPARCRRGPWTRPHHRRRFARQRSSDSSRRLCRRHRYLGMDSPAGVHHARRSIRSGPRRTLPDVQHGHRLCGRRATDSGQRRHQRARSSRQTRNSDRRDRTGRRRRHSRLKRPANRRLNDELERFLNGDEACVIGWGRWLTGCFSAAEVACSLATRWARIAAARWSRRSNCDASAPGSSSCGHCRALSVGTVPRGLPRRESARCRACGKGSQRG